MDDKDKKSEEFMRYIDRQNRIEKLLKLGTWELDIKNNILYWSDEIFNIFECFSATMAAARSIHDKRTPPNR